MMKYFRKLLRAAEASPVATMLAKPKAPMSDERLTTALKLFMDVSWNLKDATSEAWGPIMPVKVTTKFMGYGYVEGRRSAFKVNSRIRVTEADDDMDFSEWCVLVDNVPCLLIKRKGYAVGVTIIAERDFLADVFDMAAMRMNTLEDFRKMPEPVQKIMHDILEKTLEIRERRVRDNVEPIEKMLTYK